MAAGTDQVGFNSAGLSGRRAEDLDSEADF
jgi:hypothetical protein